MFAYVRCASLPKARYAFASRGRYPARHAHRDAAQFLGPILHGHAVQDGCGTCRGFEDTALGRLWHSKLEQPIATGADLLAKFTGQVSWEETGVSEANLPWFGLKAVAMVPETVLCGADSPLRSAFVLKRAGGLCVFGFRGLGAVI